MKGDAWVSLLRRIPPLMQEGLVIVTSTAAEIVVQNIVRLERDFVVVRGRMAGTQDTGRLVFIPYAQIDFAGLTKKLTEPETEALLGAPCNGPLPFQAADAAFSQGSGEAVSPLAGAPAPEPAPAEPPAEKPDPASATPTPPKLSQPSKSVLLARLRARLAGDSSKAPKP